MRDSCPLHGCALPLHAPRRRHPDALAHRGAQERPRGGEGVCSRPSVCLLLPLWLHSQVVFLFEHCLICVVVSSPIIFGNLVDSTCLLWKETCSGADGRCLLFDIDMFRLKYVGIGAAVKVGLPEKRPILVDVFKGCGSLLLRFDLVADGREEEGAGQADHQRDHHLHHLPRQDCPRGRDGGGRIDSAVIS